MNLTLNFLEMKQILFSISTAILCLLAVVVNAQTYSVSFHVNDGVSVLQSASVILDNNTQQTDANGNTSFTGLGNGTYAYSISLACYQNQSGMITVSGSNVSDTLTLVLDTANNVFFFITEGGPLASLGATVNLFNANNNYSFVTSDPFGGEMVENVPYGTYSYSISKSCFQTDTGTVVVDCNSGMGISVFSNLSSDTANNVFFFITEGGPLASLGATVNLFNANNNYSFVTSDSFGGEMVENVPYGTYSYSHLQILFSNGYGHGSGGLQ